MAFGGGLFYGSLYAACKEILDGNPNGSGYASELVKKELKIAYGRNADTDGMTGYYTPIGFNGVDFDSIFLTIGYPNENFCGNKLLIEAPRADGQVSRERVLTWGFSTALGEFRYHRDIELAVTEFIKFLDCTCYHAFDTRFPESIYSITTRLAPLYITNMIMNKHMKDLKLLDSQIYDLYKKYLKEIYHSEDMDAGFECLKESIDGGFNALNTQYIFGSMTNYGRIAVRTL